MKIAVTGASGFLGRETVQRLSCLGHDVLALGRSGHKLKSLFNDPIKVIETDYGLKNLSELFSDLDLIIHLAAVRLEDEPKDFSHFVEGNLLLTERILEAARINHVKRFCYSSSIAVYSEHNDVPYREDELLPPSTFFGISKLVGEYLTGVYQENFGIKTIHLRFSKIFGCNDQTKKSFFLYKFIEQAINNERLTIWGTGEAKRDLLYVKDAASALVRAVEAKDVTGTYNIGSGWAYSLLEIAQCVNNVFNNSGNLAFDHTKNINDRSYYLDSTLAEEKMGWKATWTLQSALEDMRKKLMKDNC